MRNMLCILRNNYYRAVSRKNYFILMLCISIVTIAAAVFFTAKMEVKGNIAVVSASGSFNIQSKYLHVEKLDKMPDMTSLVMNRYDAVVIDTGNGNYDIRTIKSNEFKLKLKQVLKNPDAVIKDEQARGIASNILGYMIMFIFIQGLLYMLMYSEDRENGTFKRIGVSPVSPAMYMAGHGIFNFLLVFAPTYILIILTKLIFNITIGLNFIKYAGLLGLLTLLSTCFSLLISSLFKKADSSNMMGQAIAVLTSLLSGCFYSFDDGNSIMKKIVLVLPQKNFINLVKGLEHGESLTALIPEITYLLIFPVVMLILAVFIVKNKFRQGEC